MVAAFTATILLSLESLEIYNTRNTVVAIENDHSYWNTTFPSFTLCPLHNLIDRVLSNDYCRSNRIYSLDDQQEFFQFIESMANATYENFDQIKDSKNIDVITF